MSISSVSSSSMMTMQGMHGGRGMTRPDPAAMAENLFAKLDTTGQGYIEKTDLQTAFDKVASSSASSAITSTAASNTPSVDDVFSQLDTDADGKVTKEEFTDSLKKLSEGLDQQFQSSRMQAAMPMGGMGGMGGMPPPPPPPEDDEGFTQDELTTQLSEIGDRDSNRSSLISSILENFEAADTNSDGKVSFKEAMAFQQSGSATATTNDASTAATSDATTTASTTATSSTTETTDAKVMLMIMKLVHAYMADSSTTTSTLLASA